VRPSEAAKIWAVFATAYAEGLRWLEAKQLPITASLYQEFLLDLDAETAVAAVRRLIATWQPTSANRYPPIPVVRAAVLAQQTGRPRTGIEAWADLRTLTGSYERERLETLDPVFRQCVEGLGWVEWRPFFSVARGEFTKWTIALGENEASDRARFCELYDRLAGAAHEDAIVGALAPPLPRPQLPRGGERSIGALIAGLLPGKDGANG
jgi:hypothetical protein